MSIPIRSTVAPCVRCLRPIRPGELYAVLTAGPQHFGCSDLFLIPLRGRDGEVRAHARVDADDFEALNRYRWSLHTGGYAHRNEKGVGCIYMARHLLGLARGDGRHVDHINGNRLDNRRSNLRIVTLAENNLNVAARSGASSHRGVFRSVRRAGPDKWRTQARYQDVVYYLGCFDSEEEAAEVVRAFWAERGVEIRGKQEAAALNFGCEQHPSRAGAATPALAIADCDAHPSPARPGCDAGAGTPSKTAA